ADRAGQDIAKRRGVGAGRDHVAGLARPAGGKQRGGRGKIVENDCPLSADRAPGKACLDIGAALPRAMMSRLVIATFVALSLGSAAIGAEPANDNQAMLAALQALDSRVAETGYRLAVAGVPFCPDAVARSGFLVHGLVQYQPAL